MSPSLWLAAPIGLLMTVGSHAADAFAKKTNHTHLAVTLSIKPSQPGLAGDMIGVYSFEIMPCEEPKLSQGLAKQLQTMVSRLGDLLISTAHANHRDHFDRIGARQVLVRVPLVQAGLFSLGEVDITPQSYCHVRLTFARLPVVTGPKPLPVLQTSVFMNRPTGLKPLALPYAVPFELPLARPWRPSPKGDHLRITLDPAAAVNVLRDPQSEEGTLGQRVVAMWRQTAHVGFSASLSSTRPARLAYDGFTRRPAAQAADFRLTSTMPTATAASAPNKPGVMLSLSQSAPNSSANRGVKKTNTEILVAGYRPSIHIHAR